MSKHTSISLPLEIVIGKDILELVTSAMYIDPLTIFREYVQNAADSIAEARDTHILGSGDEGRVELTLDVVERKVRIRDNGTGVPNGEFGKRLTALGGSKKRGTSARGFRGVGRLAGLGYCQSLVFRSRSVGDPVVNELRWDCRAFKKMVTDTSYDGDVEDLIRSVASIAELPGEDYPEHFYEVELVKPIRIKNDLLLNREEIGSYLGQIAPVPFHPDFLFGEQIKDRIKEYGDLEEINIYVDGAETPIYRPYRNEFLVAEIKTDYFTDVEFRTIDGLAGEKAAIAWLLHHGYLGAIPVGPGIKGLRARQGNIQVGDHKIFSEAFPESRFTSWTVGEVHIFDQKIIANGRRDDFEQNAHYNHLLHQLTGVGDHIARICRSNSLVRNRIKSFDIGSTKVEEKLTILEQGAVSKKEAENIVEDIQSIMFEIQKTASSSVLSEESRSSLIQRHHILDRRLKKAKTRAADFDPMKKLSNKEQEVLKKVVKLVYECSANRVAAKSLVDRMLARIGDRGLA